MVPYLGMVLRLETSRWHAQSISVFALGKRSHESKCQTYHRATSRMVDRGAFTVLRTWVTRAPLYAVFLWSAFFLPRCVRCHSYPTQAQNDLGAKKLSEVCFNITYLILRTCAFKYGITPFLEVRATLWGCPLFLYCLSRRSRISLSPEP